MQLNVIRAEIVEEIEMINCTIFMNRRIGEIRWFLLMLAMPFGYLL
jgi:hypothetical protein